MIPDSAAVSKVERSCQDRWPYKYRIRLIGLPPHQLSEMSRTKTQPFLKKKGLVRIMTSWKVGVGACPDGDSMYYVYVLKSLKDGDLYTGSTNNLLRRIKEHNDGKCFSTKTRTPFELVYYEAYRAESDAREREHNLKLRSRALVQLKRRIEASLKEKPAKHP